MTKAPVRFEAEEIRSIGRLVLLGGGENFDPYQKIADHVNARLDEWFRKNAVEVTGYLETKNDPLLFGKGIDDRVTHRAWLVGIEPLSRGVTKEEIVSALKDAVHALEDSTLVNRNFKELADRIEREGIK